jgi:translation initiation factor IF-3
LSRPFPPRSSFNQNSGTRINGRIRARVIGVSGQQVGVLTLQDALAMARSNGVDLVEVAPNATPPVCRLVDFGKYRYEQAKREKDAKKHQHANKVKEIQLSAKIDPHDMSVKLGHAIEFLCEEMKVKVSLRFRGREMAHTEVGFEQIAKFTRDVAPWGHPDNNAKLVGRGITVMFSPLPRNKRAKNPHEIATAEGKTPEHPKSNTHLAAGEAAQSESGESPAGIKPEGFQNNPFTGLDIGSPPPTE